MGSFMLGVVHGIGESYAAKKEQEREMELLAEEQRLIAEREQKKAANEAQIQKAAALQKKIEERAGKVATARSQVANIISQDSALSETFSDISDSQRRTILDSIIGDVMTPEFDWVDSFDTSEKTLKHIIDNNPRYFGGNLVERTQAAMQERQSAITLTNYNKFFKANPTSAITREDLFVGASPNKSFDVVFPSETDASKSAADIRKAESYQASMQAQGNPMDFDTAYTIVNNGLEALPVYEDGVVKSNIIVKRMVRKGTDGVEVVTLHSIANPSIRVKISGEQTDSSVRGNTLSSRFVELGAPTIPVVSSVEEAGEILKGVTPTLEEFSEEVKDAEATAIQGKKQQVITASEPFVEDQESLPVFRGRDSLLTDTNEAPNLTQQLEEALSERQPVTLQQEDSDNFYQEPYSKLFEERSKGSLFTKDIPSKKKEQYNNVLSSSANALRNLMEIFHTAENEDISGLLGPEGTVRKSIGTGALYLNAVPSLLGIGFSSDSIDDTFKLSDISQLQKQYQTLVEEYVKVLRPAHTAGRVPVEFYKRAEKVAGADGDFGLPQTRKQLLTAVNDLVQHTQQAVFQTFIDMSLESGRSYDYALGQMAAYYTDLLFDKENQEEGFDKAMALVLDLADKQGMYYLPPKIVR